MMVEPGPAVFFHSITIFTHYLAPVNLVRQFSLKERAKIERETVNRVNGKDK
jgi:hypothetical protein